MKNNPLVTRYEGNPILTKHDIPYSVETVHNAAATKYENQYILLFRSHLRNGRSILGIARSDDGYKFQADPKPFMVPSTESDFSIHEESLYKRTHGTRLCSRLPRDFERGSTR